MKEVNFTAYDDDLNELMARARADLVILIFVVNLLVKLLAKTYLRFRKGTF